MSLEMLVMGDQVSSAEQAESEVAEMSAGSAPMSPTREADWVELTSAVLPVSEAIGWVTTSGSGAVVSFLGVVRDHAEGRSGVHALTYEAFEEQATAKMREIVALARRRWPVIERIAMLHRVGHLELSEPSVAVVVSTPHRPEAFEAARFCIDTLKDTVPIWKQEHHSGGVEWGLGAHPIDPVPSS